MATLVRDASAPPATPPPQLSAPERNRLDAWPHTSRVMPWLVALFMFMVYLIPFDSTLLPIKLPFNSGLDRLVLIVIAVVWLVIAIAGPRPPRIPHSPINVAVWVFIAFTAFSLVLNLRDLVWDGELSLSFKQLLLTYTYLLFFYVAATSLTRDDVLGFCKLLVWLGAISAIGTVIEYRTGHNIFADLAHLIPGAKVGAHQIGSDLPGARLEYAGPTKHGLADATMLDAALPFALVFLARARSTADRFGWCLALIALVAGCIATDEKTAFLLLVASIVVMVLFRPRRYARLWPLLIVAAVLVRVVAPHSISALIYQFKTLGSSNSTSGRTTDYPAVAPFLDTHLLFGRGLGSYSPTKYRILDDQSLLFLIETGAFGFLSYTALMFAPVFSAFRRARRGMTLEDDLLAAMATGCVAYFVSNFLYDAFSFRQGPYVFFFLAALVAATVGRRGGTVASAA